MKSYFEAGPPCPLIRNKPSLFCAVSCLRLLKGIPKSHLPSMVPACSILLPEGHQQYTQDVQVHIGNQEVGGCLSRTVSMNSFNELLAHISCTFLILKRACASGTMPCAVMASLLRALPNILHQFKVCFSPNPTTILKLEFPYFHGKISSL